MADGARTKAPAPSARRDFLVHVAPALVWAALIFIGGGANAPQPEVDVGFAIDKVEHALGFLIMQLLAYRALRYTFPEREHPVLAWLGAAISFGVGVGLELYQLGLPHRSAELGDAVADAVGAGLGALIITLRSWATKRAAARSGRGVFPAT